MSKNRYFLIAKEQETDKFKVINLEGNEILYGENKVQDLSSLENIDLFTMNFKNKEELNKYLLVNCKVDSVDNDIFIACRNGNNLKNLECVYGDSYYLQEIAKNIGDEEGNVMRIFSAFISKMFYDINFYNYVIYKDTNIYEKFSENFRGDPNNINDYFTKLYYNSWALSSYPLIRNTVEAMNRYDERQENISSLNKKRESIRNRLYDVTDKDYCQGQISLFDYLEELEKEEKSNVYAKKNS